MSIKVMSECWDNSKAEGGALLVLLALADFADDSGVCWPSISTIAAKSRLQRRQVQRVIHELEAIGELVVDRNQARNGVNLYRIKVKEGRHIDTGVKKTRVSPTTRGGVAHDTGGVSPMTPEPSLNRHRTVIKSGANTKSKFVKPELSEVVAFFIESKSTETEAQKFFDHFESNGWRVGGRATMKNWKAASRNWIRNVPEFTKGQNTRAAENATLIPKTTYKPPLVRNGTPGKVDWETEYERAAREAQTRNER